MAIVLVIEDDPSVARMLELALTLEGYEVDVAVDGDAAVARLDRPAADLVVLDVMLPGQDGLTVLERLRERDAWADAKVVVTTALGSDDDVWRGWSAGADYYLTKPFDLDHFRHVVARLLAGLPVT